MMLSSLMMLMVRRIHCNNTMSAVLFRRSSQIIMSSLWLLALVLWMGASAEAFSSVMERPCSAAASLRIVPSQRSNNVWVRQQQQHHPQSTSAQRQFVAAAAARRGRHGARLAAAPQEDDEEEKSPSQPAAADAPPPIMTPTERILANENKLGAAERAVVEAAEARRKVDNETPSQKYPVDLPSPILLASAIVLAIAATGACVACVRASERFLSYYSIR